jgi:hypothetical protein
MNSSFLLQAIDEGLYKTLCRSRRIIPIRWGRQRKEKANFLHQFPCQRVECGTFSSMNAVCDRPLIWNNTK